MTPSELMEMGFEQGPAVGQAVRCWPALREALGEEGGRAALAELARGPEKFVGHAQLGELAEGLVAFRRRKVFVPREEPARYRVWGEDIDDLARGQMAAASRLPVAVSGALMPDAHVGYGLPIGGVLATRGAVIPYAVGVDIACRMRLSVYDVAGAKLEGLHDPLAKILQRETMFGAGATLQKRAEHAVVEEDWSFCHSVKRVHEKAKDQLGTSGSGNHFVEFGTLDVWAQSQLGLAPGSYLALLSHSGSRGPGAGVADFFSKLAMQLHPELPEDLRRLAWLDLDSDAGREYWAAMELMGRFAAANHEIIHRKIARALGEKVVVTVENHHNFAWKEAHENERGEMEEVIVHRKGATPAGAGVLGVIPGSMAAPGFVVSGRGVGASLNSASHGAGRRMSRTAAKNQFAWGALRPMLAERKVTLLSAGIDEAPPAYKDIHAVMAAQADLVEVLARFDPRIVRMADGGPAED
jgi:tRNA-splicing ligase RtcB